MTYLLRRLQKEALQVTHSLQATIRPIAEKEMHILNTHLGLMHSTKRKINGLDVLYYAYLNVTLLYCTAG